MGSGSMNYRLAIGCSGVQRWARVVIAAVVFVALAACSDDEGSPAVDVGTEVVGTCLDFGDTIGEEITKLPEVPCEEPHSHEIYAVKQVANETYPGFEALEAEAQALCLGDFEEYVGISAFDSELFFSWLVPTLTSWDRENDREVICVVGEGNGARLVGSVRGINR